MSSILPTLGDVEQLAPAFATAAQGIYDAWSQDKDGMDEELGAGGICDQIADAMVAAISEHLGGQVRATTGLCNDVQHVNVIIALREGVFEIDIPYSVYERGAAFRWQKIPGVVFTGDDVQFFRLSSDPGQFWLYVEGGERDAELEAAAAPRT